LGLDAAIEQASEMYKPAGRWAHGFARGKMSGDPAYAAVIDLMGPRKQGRLLDIGCGEGHLLALVCVARPGISLYGVDHDTSRVQRARQAMAGQPDWELVAGDARQLTLPRADVIACLDVLHYMPPAEQDELLARLAALLEPGGVLLVRDGHSSGGLRSTITGITEWLAVVTGRHKGDGVFFRTAAQLEAVLADQGLEVETRDCSQGTPFANLVWIARRREESQ
jgi:2-polyprenyl-3-methyl-5-hydroxy-6-metoxy-1,4-benzoquinol methylase